MTKTELNRALVALILTLDETPDGSAPEGILAAGLMQFAMPFDVIRLVMVDGGLAKVEQSMMKITAKGRDMAYKIRRATEAPC